MKILIQSLMFSLVLIRHAKGARFSPAAFASQVGKGGGHQQCQKPTFLSQKYVLGRSNERSIFQRRWNHVGLHMAPSSSNSQQKRSKGKNRTLELTQLAKQLKAEPKALYTLLQQQRKKMDNSSEKAKYIDWMLAEPVESILAGGKAQPARPMPIKSGTKAKETKKVKAQPVVENDTNIQDQTLLTSDNFAERTDLHPNSKRALTEVLGITSMTEIQSKTFAAAASGKDVLGRARTGTGKTLAFLVPALERILQDSDSYTAGENIGVLVISPTRELASQIGDQAEKLLTFHKDMNVQVVFGGTNMKRDINQFKRRLPTVLVATPGRLLDHLQSTDVNGQKFGNDVMRNTPVVVLDETDRLLDMGFRREIQKILNYLPKGNHRQTLLFSATIPSELKVIMKQTMKDDYIEVDCINDGDGSSHTSAKVDQSHVIIPTLDRYVSAVVEIVNLALEEGGDDAKVVVFFPTARMVAFFAEFFNDGLNIPVIELHSKKSQGYRNRASEQFRQATNGVLFTSDVSARGVDYPGVTQVIQFGIPESREQYIHRLGRTGRAGKKGTGWLVLGPFESLFLQELKGMKIPRNDQLTTLLEDPILPETEDLLISGTKQVRSGNKKLRSSAQGAYQAFLGFYLGQMKRMRMRSKDELVSIANEFSMQMGLAEIPGLTKNMVGKMGLKNIHGVVIKANDDKPRRQGPGAGPGKRGHNDGRRKPNSGRNNRRN